MGGTMVEPAVRCDPPRLRLDEPLKRAAGCGDVAQLAQLLAHAHADPNASCGRRNLLMVAIDKNRPQVLKLLLEDPRIDPSRPTATGDTPLRYALGRRRAWAVAALAAHPRTVIDPVGP